MTSQPLPSKIKTESKFLDSNPQSVYAIRICNALLISEKHILILDDDTILVDTLVSVLGVYNSVQQAHSLTEALPRIKDCSQLDLVLLDQNLPDGLGTDLIPLIRERFEDATIVLMTGNADYHSVSQCIKAGANDYLIKSGHLLQDLLARIPLATAAMAAKKHLKRLEAMPDCVLPGSLDALSRSHFDTFRSQAEISYFKKALKLCNGDASLAAKKMGMGRSTLFKKLSELRVVRDPQRKYCASPESGVSE